MASPSADCAATAGSESENEEEKMDFEDWGEDEPAPTKCLFTDRVFDSVHECLAHSAESFGLDLMQVIRKLALDTYGCIALVNFIRASMAAPGSDAAAVAKAVNDCDTSLRQAFPWRDDKYMQPVLEDDPLLYSLAAGVEDDDDDQDPAEGGRLISAKSGSEDSGSEQMNAMMAEMRAMQAQMAGILGDFVGGDETNAPLGRGERESTGVEAAAKTPTSGLALLGSPVGPSGKRVDAADDSSYFASYGRLGIHEEMLADHVRTDGYRQAIEGNGAILRDKVVMDVGCGSGILSMFAARAGARRVLGIDASDIIDAAKAVVELNQLSHVVELHHSTLETFVLPDPLQKVDILVSEWMGYALLYESMLPTLITARDRFLAPGGAILPSATSLLLAGSSHDRLAFFNDVYGFNYAPFIEPNRAEASVEVVPEETLLTASEVFRTFNMLTVTNDDLDFNSPFSLMAVKAGSLRSFVIHFDTHFDLTSRGGKSTLFRTAPEDTPTHWKQTVLYLRRPRELSQGSVVSGIIAFSRNNTYERGYDFALTIQVDGGPKDTQLFRMT